MDTTKILRRIGAACKWLNDDGKPNKPATFTTSTVKYISGLSGREKTAYLNKMVEHNLQALQLQIELVGALPSNLRMWRLGSDLLPLRTHERTKAYYDSDYAKDFITNKLKILGKLARKKDVRLSFHPGQFVVLGSTNAKTRRDSLAELQYHCDVFDSMGYKGWHDHGVCVNVHVGCKNPNIAELRSALQSSEAIANFVTLENDEFCWGAKEIVETFGDLVPLVLDVHHYWIMRGRRILPNSSLVGGIVSSWRGVRPKMHLSISDEELLSDIDSTGRMKMSQLIELGKKKTQLRAHSQKPWHLPTLDYAKRFHKKFDIMWEGKDKNLGAQFIAKHYKVGAKIANLD